MRTTFVAVVATGVIGAAPMANAFTVDFTSDIFADFTHTYSAAEIAGGPLTVSLEGARNGNSRALTSTANGVSASENASIDADGGHFLALDFDGIGVNGPGTGADDELINPETITVSFSRTVEIASVFLLDFFSSSLGTEIAFLNGDDLVESYTFDATAAPGSGGFFGSNLVPSLIADAIVFSAPTGVGDDGNIDFALAALDLSVVPLPASVLLLVGGLAGFAAFSRRQTA